jgi:hypothetical protein
MGHPESSGGGFADAAAAKVGVDCDLEAGGDGEA